MILIFFFVGLKSVEDANFLLKKILKCLENENKSEKFENEIEEIDSVYEKFYEGMSFEKGKHVITVKRLERKGSNDFTVYQFILKLYEREDQILGGFDLPCCAIGYSRKKNFFCTPLGAFSIARNM